MKKFKIREIIKQNAARAWGIKVILCTLSLMLLGLGCGINVVTAQGADPITVFYEGLSKVTGISVGMVASILNASLVAAVFFISKKYVHIGTVIYIFILGTFINLGIWIYKSFQISEVFVWQILFSLLGCLFCFIGLGGFMAVDIGVDPWTAMAVIISKKMKKSFRIVKIVLDALTLLFGWLMGGRVGIITLFCVFVGGPIIQKSYELLDKAFDKVIKSDCKNQIKNE